MDNYDEYLICKVRGHTENVMAGTVSSASYGALTWRTCKYCRTLYATKVTSEQFEKNIPTPPETKEQTS